MGVASAGLLKLVEKRELELVVPHCDQHSDGAELDLGAHTQNLEILFRSKPYADQFSQANSL